MPNCQVCFKEIFSSKLKTIGGQIVCSLSCVGLLNSNDKDSCYYCKRPIWKDNYFKINDFICCSEICKDIILEELKIPKNSNLIKHFSESTFIKDNPNFLKNTKKLREEVLKVYNDFKFEESNENQKEKEKEQKTQNGIKDNKIINKIKINKNYIKLKEHKSQNNLKHYKLVINNNYLLKNKNINLKQRNSLKNNKNQIEKVISRNNKLNLDKTINIKKNYNFKSHIIPKTSSHINFQILNDTINVKREKKNDLDKGNINKYEGYYTFYNNNSHKNINYNNYQFNNNILYIDNHYNYLYNNQNTIDNDKKQLSQIKLYNNTINKDFSQRTFTKLNKHCNSYKNFKICKTCLKNLGNTTFFDRNGNNFCSDKCKTEFLTYNH